MAVGNLKAGGIIGQTMQALEWSVFDFADRASKDESGWLIDSSDPKGQCVWSESDIENPLSSDV